jgi:hypothetical protein
MVYDPAMDELTPSGDPREDIARLEEHIEELEARLENCRKFAAASRFAMALGAVLLLGLLFGIIPFDELALVGGMASGLGGVVMLGSNNSTAKAASSELAEANAARAALIGRIELRVVESPPTLH